MSDPAEAEVDRGQRVAERVDRPVAHPDDLVVAIRTRVTVAAIRSTPFWLDVDHDFNVERAGREVLAGEDLVHLGGVDLAAFAVGVALDDLAELDLQPTRQVELVLGLHDVGDAALAGLRVHPDHGLVGAADVLRIDRQVRDLPPHLADRLTGPPGLRSPNRRSPS